MKAPALLTKGKLIELTLRRVRTEEFVKWAAVNTDAFACEWTFFEGPNDRVSPVLGLVRTAAFFDEDGLIVFWRAWHEAETAKRHVLHVSRWRRAAAHFHVTLGDHAYTADAVTGQPLWRTELCGT